MTAGDELSEILRRLREADDLLTPEHVAQRFGALLDDVTQDKETPRKDPPMPLFKDRFTVIPDTGVTQLHCHPCNVVIWQSYHPSLDVLIEQARAHNLAEHA